MTYELKLLDDCYIITSESKLVSMIQRKKDESEIDFKERACDQFDDFIDSMKKFFVTKQRIIKTASI